MASTLTLTEFVETVVRDARPVLVPIVALLVLTPLSLQLAVSARKLVPTEPSSMQLVNALADSVSFLVLGVFQAVFLALTGLPAELVSPVLILAQPALLLQILAFLALLVSLM